MYIQVKKKKRTQKHFANLYSQNNFLNPNNFLGENRKEDNRNSNDFNPHMEQTVDILLVHVQCKGLLELAGDDFEDSREIPDKRVGGRLGGVGRRRGR